jgi:hypothetical protein
MSPNGKMTSNGQQSPESSARLARRVWRRRLRSSDFIVVIPYRPPNVRVAPCHRGLVIPRRHAILDLRHHLGGTVVSRGLVVSVAHRHVTVPVAHRDPNGSVRCVFLPYQRPDRGVPGVGQLRRHRQWR